MTLIEHSEILYDGETKGTLKTQLSNAFEQCCVQFLVAKQLNFSGMNLHSLSLRFQNNFISEQ